MESLRIIEFLEKCEHVQAFKRVKPMIVRMVDLRCDAEKVGSYRFKLYPDVAKLDLLARHIYLFQIQTYVQPSFLKRDFKVLGLVMGLEETLIQEIFLSIRGAPHNSEFRNENDLLLEMSIPIIRELELVEDLNIDNDYGLMQWICGHLILNPKLLKVWDRPELEEKLISILEKNLVKYLGNKSLIHEKKLAKLREIQRDLIAIRKNSSEELNLESITLDTPENSRSTINKKLIFDYPLDLSTAYWLSFAIYGGILFLFLIFNYFWIGLILSLIPSYWIFKNSVHDKRLIFLNGEEFEIHRNGKKLKLALSDILRVERFENAKMKGMRLIFRNANLEPLEIYSSFGQYQTLLNYLQDSVVSDRILSPAECVDIV